VLDAYGLYHDTRGEQYFNSLRTHVFPTFSWTCTQSVYSFKTLEDLKATSGIEISWPSP
jgi:hypothetical protein